MLDRLPVRSDDVVMMPEDIVFALKDEVVNTLNVDIGLTARPTIVEISTP
jgi:hypothetical protein